MAVSRKVIILAVVLGLLTSLMVFRYAAGLRAEETTTAEATNVGVMVANRSISANTTLEPGMLEHREMPVDLVDPDAVIDRREAEGRIARREISAGEVVMRSRLHPPGFKPALTYAIPPGKRAVTVSVNEVIGVAGFIKPGDRVDVLGTFDEDFAGTDITVTVLQNMEVLAIAQEMEVDQDEKARVSTTVTLAMDLTEAEKLTMAEERGRLRLALRSLEARGRDTARGVEASDVIGRPVSRPEPAQPAQPSRSDLAAAVRQAAQQVMATNGQQPTVSLRRVDPDSVVEVIRGTRKEQVILDD